MPVPGCRARLHPSGLARFYAELLGWQVGHEEPGTAVVAAAPQGPFFVFQQADGYRPPVWPPAGGEQRPMMHFDFDPAGQPFCLCFDSA